MKFHFPYDPATGQPGDGSVPWINGDPAAGIEGSVPPAEAIADPMREIANVIDAVLGDGTEGSGQDGADLTQLLQAIRRFGVPTGMLMPFTGLNYPQGWLLCNRQEVSRATYADLFAHAQASGAYDATGAQETMYGPGSTAETFQLPDVRGRFIRALDLARGFDLGRPIGTFQQDELRSHTHTINTGGAQVLAEGANGASLYNPGAQSGATGGGETRPVNVAFPWLVKT